MVRLLFGVRSLPAVFWRRDSLTSDGRFSLRDQMLGFGFVFLGEVPGREIVAGVIGQMWKPGGGLVPSVQDAREFAAFEGSGCARAVMNFSIETEGTLTKLYTQTRVHCTDAGARRKFGGYWRQIRPGSAAIRDSWLRAAKRCAERRVERASGNAP